VRNHRLHPPVYINTIYQVETFEETFGKKKSRKRPKIAAGDLGELLLKAEEASSQYVEEKDSNVKVECEYMDAAKENIFMKGQSRRIWGELHKVVDSSDVLVQVRRAPRVTTLSFILPSRKPPDRLPLASAAPASPSGARRPHPVEERSERDRSRGRGAACARCRGRLGLSVGAS
jgi:hypothetical protein